MSLNFCLIASSICCQGNMQYLLNKSCCLLVNLGWLLQFSIKLCILYYIAIIVNIICELIGE